MRKALLDFTLGAIFTLSLVALYAAVDVWTRRGLQCEPLQANEHVMSYKESDGRVEFACRRKSK